MPNSEYNGTPEKLDNINGDVKTENTVFNLPGEHNENFENNDILETFEKSNDTENASVSVEENFAKKIDSISLDELKAERDRLIELGALNGDEIARRYAEFIKEQKNNDGGAV